MMKTSKAIKEIFSRFSDYQIKLDIKCKPLILILLNYLKIIRFYIIGDSETEIITFTLDDSFDIKDITYEISCDDVVEHEFAKETYEECFDLLTKCDEVF